MSNLEQQINRELGIQEACNECQEIQWGLGDIEKYLDIAEEAMDGEAMDGEGIEIKNQNVQKVHAMLRAIGNSRQKMNHHASNILEYLNYDYPNPASTLPSFKENNNVATAEKVIDPIVAQGRRLAVLEKEHNRLDKATTQNDKPDRRSAYYKNRMDDLNTEIDAVQKSISFIKATDLEGAAIQVAILSRFLDFDPAELEKHCARLLYSIMDVIMQNISLRPEDVSIDRLMPWRMNPWTDIEEILDRLEKE